MWDRPSTSEPEAAAVSLPGRRLWTVLLLAATTLLAAGLTGLAPSARANVGCDVFGSPSGSDSGPGSYQQPFRTVQEVVNSLHAGQTGCLESGTYNGDVRIGRGGRPGAPMTLTVAPGQAATVVGRVAVMSGANYVNVSGLTLNGTNATQLPSPTVLSDHVTFSYDDVTDDHTGICFVIGSAGWGRAMDTLLTHDRIHDCGQLTADDNYQHGVYIAEATGTTVEWSLIYANAARGIQLYPDAQYSTIDHNIIDDNGEGIIIAGEDGSASSHANIYDNVVSDATSRHDVESYWPAGNPIGVGNSVHDNCVWAGREGTIDTSGGGLRASDNLDMNPEFADAQTHDYEMSPNSPCLALVGDVQAAVDGTQPITPAQATMDATRKALMHAARHKRPHRRAKKKPHHKRR